MFSWRRFLAVAKKEFLEIKRNLLLFMVLLMGPIMLFLLHAYGLTLDVKNLNMGVLDLDKSALSRNLQDTFQNSKMFQIKKNARDITDLETGLRLAELRAGVVIPENFSEELKRNSQVAIQAILDGSYTNNALVSLGYIDAAVSYFNLNLLENYFKRYNGTTSAVPLPIDVNATVWYNPTFKSDYFMIPGLLGLTILFFPAVMAALSLTKEKETRSILNFYCSSVTKSEYLLGKMFPYVIIAFLQCLFCSAYAFLLMEVPMRGSLLAFLAASFLFSAVAVGIGLCIGLFVTSQAAAILITTISTMTFTFTYSGIITPVMCLSEDNRVISNLLPVTHFIDITRNIMIKGSGFLQVQNGLMALLVSCFVLYGAAILIFRKRLG